MKSTQIFPMFISLTEDQEVTLCGGESNVVSYSYSSQVIIDKKGANKQIKKVVKTKTTKGKTSASGILKSLGIDLSSLLKFHW
ncbi:hypothetical protein H6G96_05785 [Nostoc sp. FACHB-892]|uniref:hypothetical protein n=1 Tax=Nostoc sp. FACHB-892 TaxID=2692843 RepID=UPI00168207F8|nr:hypothetical protein [Nostoc sp. FACHB-892]MBD2725844.1 hypothetical protein [Nostoc sp. FACHB-892]